MVYVDHLQGQNRDKGCMVFAINSETYSCFQTIFKGGGMSNRRGAFYAILFASLIFSIGCNRKVTKIAPAANAKSHTTVSTSAANAEQPYNDSFSVSNLSAKMKGVFLPIYFKFDKYDLSDSSISILGKIASFLQDNPDIRILIEGNADEIGTDEYNMALGEKRARAAKSYLTTYGINAGRLEITSYGKERPAVPNCPIDDDNCRSKNRRDEWKALGQ